MKKFRLFLFLFALVGGLVSCSSDDDASGSKDKARLMVKLTDAPGDYRHVWVEVKDVMIKSSTEGSDEEGWKSLENVKTGRIDLLSLTGGITELLVDTKIDAGYLHQIRLVLGENNTLVLNNDSEAEYSLKTPSGQESGLKVKVDETLEAGEEYTFILDFDVDKSIVVTGNGGYNLKPVLRAAIEEKAGTIVGSVHPTTHQTLITVQNATVTSSAYTNAEGNFQIHGLPAGTYKLTATPAASMGLDAKVRNDLKVEAGATVKLEPIFLDKE